MILNWLDSTYETRPILSAVLYFHRISDNRVPARTPMRILRDFQKLFGENDMSRVTLVTTMWDEEEDDVGEEKLKELEEIRPCNYFDPNVRRTVEQEELRLREGISNMKSELWETTAGQELGERADQKAAQGLWKEFAQAQALRRTRVRMTWIRFIFARVLARHWGRK
ncbi:hypothetical protein EV401DRAFT_1966179 [Pisolithus croceorrhizus]|nr:hypothetical protein EV401DRAFT_1966179 [Pisolithus croceorrhizus]